MKVKTVNYQKTFNLGNYTSERVGFEVELDKGETVEDALAKMKTMATEWHEANNPQLYGPGAAIREVPQNQNLLTENADYAAEWNRKPLTKEQQIENIIKEIGTCKEMKVLEGYKLIAKNYGGEVSEAYNKKVSELSDSEPLPIAAPSKSKKR